MSWRKKTPSRLELQIQKLKNDLWTTLDYEFVNDINAFMHAHNDDLNNYAEFTLNRRNPAMRDSFTPFQFLFLKFAKNLRKRAVVDQFMNSFWKKLVGMEIDNYGLTELMDACYVGDLDRIDFLLRKFTKDKDAAINKRNTREAIEFYIGGQPYRIHPTALTEATRTGNLLVAAHILHAMSDSLESNNNKADTLLTLIMDQNAPNRDKMIKLILNNMTSDSISTRTFNTIASLTKIAQDNQYGQKIQDRLDLTNHLNVRDDATQDYTSNNSKPVNAIMIPTRFLEDVMMDWEDQGILNIVRYNQDTYALIPTYGGQRNPDDLGTKIYTLQTNGNERVIIRFSNYGFVSFDIKEYAMWAAVLTLAFI